MSETTGPFDAAIKYLADTIRTLEIHALADTSTRERKLYQGQADELRASLRILEAAGKVEKISALTEIDDCYFSKSINPWCTEARILGEIRALLESLPDKEAK